MLYSELDKVSAFFNERENDASSRYRVLQDQLDELAEHRLRHEVSHFFFGKCLSRLDQLVSSNCVISNPMASWPSHSRGLSSMLLVVLQTCSTDPAKWKTLQLPERPCELVNMYFRNFH